MEGSVSVIELASLKAQEQRGERFLLVLQKLFLQQAFVLVKYEFVFYLFYYLAKKHKKCQHD